MATNFSNFFESTLGTISDLQSQQLRRDYMQAGLDDQRRQNEAARNNAFQAQIFQMRDDEGNPVAYLDPNDPTRVVLADNFLPTLDKQAPAFRSQLLNLDNTLQNYVADNGIDIERGQLGTPMARTTDAQGNRLVPTSLQTRLERAEEGTDEYNEALQEIEAWKQSDNAVYMIPITRQDGVFSFLTRNRSSADNDEAILLSGSELQGIAELQLNSLQASRNPTATIAGSTLSSLAGSLQPEGVGPSGITIDNVAQSSYNAAVDPTSGLTGGELTEALGQSLAIVTNSMDEEKRKRLDALNIGFTPSATPTPTAVPIEDRINNFMEASAEEQRATIRELGSNLNRLSSRYQGLTPAQLREFAESEGSAPLRAQFEEDTSPVTNPRNRYQEREPVFTGYGVDPEAAAQPSTGGQAPGEAQPRFTMNDIDTSDFPDLQNITTREQALELLGSQQVKSFMTDERIAQARSVLERENVTDAASFTQAANEGRISNPYLFSLVIANAIAGPETSEADIRTTALNLFNNIKTADPSTTPGQLIGLAQDIETLRYNYSKLDDDRRATLRTELTSVTDTFNTIAEGYLSLPAQGDPDYDADEDSRDRKYNEVVRGWQTLTRSVKASLPGATDEQITSLLLDPQGQLLASLQGQTGPLPVEITRAAEQFRQSIGNRLYDTIAELGTSAGRFFTSDFWGDWTRASSPNKFAEAEENLRWVLNAQGAPEKLVAVRIGADGRAIETDYSISAQDLRRRAGSEMDWYFKLIPALE